MTETKWTPGPWRVERRAEDEWWIMAGDTLVAVVYADDAEAGQANANLISAAHGLREACEEALRVLEVRGTKLAAERMAVRMLTRALRKALGEDA